MFSFKFLGKTHIPHHKNTADMPAVRMPSPKEVLLPMAQHIGAPATPIVKIGDEVKLGQRIADPTGFVSSPIYASVSGKVSKIEEYLRPDGSKVQAVRIVSDGQMQAFEGLTPPTVDSLDALIEAVKESGLVGLGGAGFPTAVKLGALKGGKVDKIVVNGAECEPFITSDTRTMLDNIDLIREAVALFERFAPSVKQFIFGVEANKPSAIAKLKEAFAQNDKVVVKKLPARYPQGAEKVLVYNTTGLVIPEGKLPADVGAIVINVTTLAVIASYVKTGMPLVERTVTVDGSAVKEPKNVIAPIGTSLAEIIEFAGGYVEPIGKALVGGPMMGKCAASLDEPITKTTGSILLFNVKDSEEKQSSNCIHCGRCISSCPLALNPVEYSRALDYDSREERIAILKREKIMLCMECGCCSYVCPAKRPLVQNNVLAKAQYRAYLAEQKAKEQK